MIPGATPRKSRLKLLILSQLSNFEPFVSIRRDISATYQHLSQQDAELTLLLI
jgi:hypothetical protein